MSVASVLGSIYYVPLSCTLFPGGHRFDSPYWSSSRLVLNDISGSPANAFPYSDSPSMRRAISWHRDRYWISPSKRKSTNCTFKSLGLHLQRVWAQRCPTLSTSWSYGMASLSTRHTRVGIGCTHSGFLWGNFGLDLIDYEWRPAIIYHDLIRAIRCVTYRSPRRSYTSFPDAQYTMRSEDITIAFIETWGAPCLLSFVIRTKDAQPSSSRRYSTIDLNSYIPHLALEWSWRSPHTFMLIHLIRARRDELSSKVPQIVGWWDLRSPLNLLG